MMVIYFIQHKTCVFLRPKPCHICRTSRMIQALSCFTATTTPMLPPLPSSPPTLYLCLVALLQGSQVADEAHGEAAPLLRLGVLSQAVQQYPCVPSPSQQPQRLHLWEVVWLQRRAGRRSKGHFTEATWVTHLSQVYGRKSVFLVSEACE